MQIGTRRIQFIADTDGNSMKEGKTQRGNRKCAAPVPSCCPGLDAHEPDSCPRARLLPTTLVLHNVAVSGQRRRRTNSSRDTRGKPRGKTRGGGLGEKELQLSSQTRTICLICVTCFLLIWEVCWRDLGVWERPGRAGPWAKASLRLGSLSEWH